MALRIMPLLLIVVLPPRGPASGSFGAFFLFMSALYL
jgi:hypothetical protein